MTPCLALLLPSEGPSWCIEQGCGSGLVIHSFGQRWQVQFFLAVLLYKTGKNIKLVRTVFILLLNLASNQDWTPPCTRGLTTRAVYSIWRSRVLAVIEVSRLTREDTVVLDHNLSKQTLISLGFSRLLLCAKSTGFCTENSAAPRNAVQPTAVHPICWPCFKQDIRLETPGVLFPPELPHGSALWVCKMFACFSHLWLVLKGSREKQVEGTFINLLCLDAVTDRIEEGWEEDVGVEDGGASFANLCRMG